MPKPKILFLAHLPPPVHGAAMAGSFIKNSEYINSHVDSTYINLATNTELGKSGKGSLKKIKVLRALIKKVVASLRQNEYDLCHMSLTASGLGFYKDFILVCILKKYKVNILYHFHNKGVANASGSGLNRRLYRYVFKNTESILLSPNLYKDVSRYVDEEHVYYCPYGIPDNPRIQGMNPVRSTSDTCSFLFLSNMIEEKGVYTVLEALKILKDDYTNIECHFVGGWSDVTPEIFENYVRSNGLSEFTFAHGPKYDSEKDEFFQKADVFVFPTFYHYETFGIVNLEAMQHALPIISTTVGGIPDIIVEGETGFLVPQKNPKALAEKMKIFIENPEMREAFGKAGKKRYEDRFTLNTFEHRLSDILLEASLQ